MELLEILKYTLPSVVVFATAYYGIKMFLDREDKNKKFEIVANRQKIITPMRLQAYERVILFLERISPESLILRVQEAGISAKELQIMMLHNIRTEFEHNLSQQIYISNEAWEMVKMAKENMVKLVNIAATRVEAETSAMELSRVILDMFLQVENPPLVVAIEKVKKEISETFM